VRPLALVAVVACSNPSPLSSPAPVDNLAAKLEPIRVAEKLPALGMAAWRDGQLVALGVTGTRRADDPAHPITAGDQWHLGSDTKAMTATLIGIYVDRGLLHWNDSIGIVFHGEAVDSQLAAVTVDQLLQHRAGFNHDVPMEVRFPIAPDDRASIVRAVIARPLPREIGKYFYSNVSYIVAGGLLERATGKSWEQLMRDDVFAPLHMTSCGFGPPGDAARVDEPWGHSVLDGKPVPPGPGADNLPWLGPAGTVHCSLEDWGKFLVVHAAPSPLLSAATFEHLHSGTEYMAGWALGTWGGDPALIHEGSNTMWHAITVVVPVRHVAIAVVANRYDPKLSEAIQPVFTPYLER
jgi:CubicO group peptidase (beta-lactamase class C family)